MAIPSGHIPNALPFSQLHSADYVLQYLVESMSNVKVAICVGWSIVQYKWTVGGPFTALPGVELVGASL